MTYLCNWKKKNNTDCGGRKSWSVLDFMSLLTYLLHTYFLNFIQYLEHKQDSLKRYSWIFPYKPLGYRQGKRKVSHTWTCTFVGFPRLSKHASYSWAWTRWPKLEFGTELGAICLSYMIKDPFISPRRS